MCGYTSSIYKINTVVLLLFNIGIVFEKPG